MTRLTMISDWIESKPIVRDIAPILLLTLLWVIYFWRVITPNPLDQVSLPQGDFSGQFLAFGAYQARRLLAGEIPLWNPYNNAGHPFLADTQSAVFYPVRLLTIVLSNWLGGWSYSALQAEVLTHYWLASMFMYTFVARLTESRVAGLVSAIIFTYGGYLTGYPPLQVALLEAAIWMPLGLVGILEATRQGENFQIGHRTRGLILAGVSLGCSLLAGHPQTSLFMIYLLIAFLIYRAIKARLGTKLVAVGLITILGSGFGLSAVQIIPGLEYTALSTRTELTFDARANGFPFSDLVTILIPNVFTTWSPLYSGITALVLIGMPLWFRAPVSKFWLMVAVVAMVVAFGGSTLVYQLAYLSVPGIALFRGQERAAYIAATAVAILAGIGLKPVLTGELSRKLSSRQLSISVLVAWFAAVEILIFRVAMPTEQLSLLTQAAFFLAILITLNGLILMGLLLGKLANASAVFLLLAVIIFDLFSTTFKSNWEPVPAAKRQMLSELVDEIPDTSEVARVDGRVGLGENYGTLTGLQDIWGTSPLRLKTLSALLKLPQYRAHEMLAVKYVFTDWTQLEVPSTVLAETHLGATRAMLHEINDPFPRAWMTHFVVVSSDSESMASAMSDPAVDLRHTVFVDDAEVFGDINGPSSEDDRINLVSYAPEKIVMDVDAGSRGVLVVSEMAYPGWEATVDGVPTKIHTVDITLRGILLEPGRHSVEMVFRPISFTIGSIISITTLLTVVAAVVLSTIRIARQVSTT